MKRKFILYPAVALALMTSASLSSCVDTDEPESLANLRDAVAQREKAQAGYIDAKSEVEKAYVAVVNAKARLDDANAVAKELDNALKEVQNATSKLKEQIAQDSISAVKDITLQREKAKQEKSLQEALMHLDNAKKDYENAVRDNQKAIEETILNNKVALARMAAEGTTQENLANALKAWNSALETVATDQKNLAKAVATYNPESLQKEIDKQKRLVAYADADLKHYQELLKAENYGDIITEWKSLKAQDVTNDALLDQKKEAKQKLDYEVADAKLLDKKNALEGAKNNAQNKVDKYNKDENTEGSVKYYEKKYNDLKKEIKETDPTKAATEYDNAKTLLTFDCANDVLNKWIATDHTDLCGFTFDSKNKKYLLAGVKNSEIESKVADLRNAFSKYGNKLSYNELHAKAIKERAVGEAARLQGEIVGTDKPYNNWKKAVDDLNSSGTNKDNYSGRYAEFVTTTYKLFGNGTALTPEAVAKGIKVDMFLSTDVYTNAASFFMAKFPTEFSKEEEVWAVLGLYGQYMTAAKTKNDVDSQVSIYESAKAVVEAIDKVVDNYKTTRKSILDEGNLYAGGSRTDADSDAVPAVKAAKDALEKAKTEKAAAEAELNTAKANLAANEYDKKYNDFEAEWDKIVDDVQATRLKAIVTMLEGFITNIDDGDSEVAPAFTTVEKFDAYAAYIIDHFNTVKQSAEFDLGVAQKKLEQFNNQDYSDIDELKALAETLANDQKTAKEKEDEYNTLKSYYGK
jgi:hypothetical protein